jgi:pSer/pThr/pTyr-binding forkhead associated (FHA) protein
MPKLIITKGDREGTAFTISEEAKIGRSPGIPIRLRDSRASREHAQIRKVNSSWAVKDLGSTNGTFVNDKRVSQGTLSHGDQIRIGSTEFLFLDSEGDEKKTPPPPKIDLGLPPPRKLTLDLPEPKTIQVKLKPTKNRRDRLR